MLWISCFMICIPNFYVRGLGISWKTCVKLTISVLALDSNLLHRYSGLGPLLNFS